MLLAILDSFFFSVWISIPIRYALQVISRKDNEIDLGLFKINSFLSIGFSTIEAVRDKGPKTR